MHLGVLCKSQLIGFRDDYAAWFGSVPALHCEEPDRRSRPPESSSIQSRACARKTMAACQLASVAMIGGHWAAIAAMDFFTVEVLTLVGLVRYHVLVVIDLASRRVEIAGIVREPYDGWMRQLARNLTDGFPIGHRHLIMDRAPMFTVGFRALLAGSALKSRRRLTGGNLKENHRAGEGLRTLDVDLGKRPHPSEITREALSFEQPERTHEHAGSPRRRWLQST